MITKCLQCFSQAQVIIEREWLVYRSRMRGMIINFFMIQPFSFSGVQGYIKPLMYFGHPLGRKAVLVFAGSLVLYFIHRTFSFATAFFYDMNRQKQVQFQAQTVPLGIIYAVRIVFAAFFGWFFLAPMFPIAKFILGTAMYTDDTIWSLLIFNIALISVMMTSYAFMAVSAVDSMYGISKIRVRLNEILMWMGGFNAAWYAMSKSGRVWGVIGLLNPFTYATEATRGALTPGIDILPLSLTLPMIMGWTVVFLGLGYWFCSRRVWTGSYRVKL